MIVILLCCFVVHCAYDEKYCKWPLHHILFYPQEQLSQVLDAMFERKVEPGDHVIDQGDDGDNFYVIDRYFLCFW